jgi:hypothetical protein
MYKFFQLEEILKRKHKSFSETDENFLLLELMVGILLR